MASKRQRHRRSRKRQRQRRSRRRSVAKKRNWAELPRDVILVIFRKLGAVEVLLRAQAVCRPWRQLSLEPQFWRCINMRYPSNLDGCMQLTRQAIDRSGGLIEEFYTDYLVSDDLLTYIADRATGLRCLVLVSACMVSGKGLAEFARRSPLLEELEITKCNISPEAYGDLGRSCSKLRHFRLNKKWCGSDKSDSSSRSDYEVVLFDRDRDARDISNSMTQLSELQLIGNQMTNKGLEAILDKCLLLESLDIRACFNVKVDDVLREKLAKVNTVRLPYDSTDDYELKYGPIYSDLDGTDSESSDEFRLMDFFEFRPRMWNRIIDRSVSNLLPYL